MEGGAECKAKPILLTLPIAHFPPYSCCFLRRQGGTAGYASHSLHVVYLVLPSPSRFPRCLPPLLARVKVLLGEASDDQQPWLGFFSFLCFIPFLGYPWSLPVILSSSFASSIFAGHSGPRALGAAGSAGEPWGAMCLGCSAPFHHIIGWLRRAGPEDVSKPTLYSLLLFFPYNPPL